MKTLTLVEAEKLAKLNLGSGDKYSYGGAIAFAGLFLKLYKTLPKIGLSGHQAEMAKEFAELVPDANIPLEPGREKIPG